MPTCVAPIVSFLVFLAASPPAVRKPADPLSVVAAVQDAGLRRDAALLERLYAPDYFHTNPNGSIMSLAAVLASYRAAPTMTFSAADTSEQRLVLHDRLAVVSERVALHGKTEQGDPFVSSYRITYVLERRAPGWLVVNSHSSLLIDKNPGGSR